MVTTSIRASRHTRNLGSSWEYEFMKISPFGNMHGGCFANDFCFDSLQTFAANRSIFFSLVNIQMTVTSLLWHHSNDGSYMLSNHEITLNYVFSLTGMFL